MADYKNLPNNFSRRPATGTKTKVTTKTGTAILIVYAGAIVVVAVLLGLFG